MVGRRSELAEKAMFKRRKLGSIYVKSPAQEIQSTLGNMVSNLMFSIIACAVYYGIFRYIIIGIWNFLRVEIAEEENPLPVNSPIFLAFIIMGMVGLVLYIFTRRVTKR